MYVNVFFVIRYLYSAASLTLVREQRFIRIIIMIMIIIIIITTIITLLLVFRSVTVRIKVTRQTREARTTFHRKVNRVRIWTSSRLGFSASRAPYLPLYHRGRQSGTPSALKPSGSHQRLFPERKIFGVTQWPKQLTPLKDSRAFGVEPRVHFIKGWTN